MGLVAKSKLTIKFTEESWARYKHQLSCDVNLLTMFKNPRQYEANSDEYLVIKIAKAEQWNILKLLMEIDADLSVESKKNERRALSQYFVRENAV